MSKIVTTWLFPEDLTCHLCGEELGFCDCASAARRCGELVCRLCGKDISASYEAHAAYRYRCKQCQEQFLYLRAHRSVYVYEGVVRAAIQRFKYKDRPDLAVPFGREMAALYRSLAARDLSRSPALRSASDGSVRDWAGVDWIGFVPIRWTRRLVRGYNQAEELAIVVGEQTGLPVVDALRRVKTTKRLNRLKKEDRKRELDNAIMVKTDCAERVRESKVLLIDDIYTTGATLNAAAKALYHAGAREIVALTIARGNDGTAEL